jgi:hypothetical protein
MKTSKVYLFYLVLFFLAISCRKIQPETQVNDLKNDTIAVNIDSTIVTSNEETIKLKELQQRKLNKEQQIASALQAAPEESRSGAKVYGYDNNGNFTTLKEGNNKMICIADDPKKDGFEVVSYHYDLEPYMARGRALKAEGKSFAERRDIREKEAVDSTLKMPETPSTLHILYGENGYFDIDSMKVKNAKYRYVVYIPFATQESTGLSLKPNAPGHPWLMFPGKANAHIMITPPTNQDE